MKKLLLLLALTVLVLHNQNKAASASSSSLPALDQIPVNKIMNLEKMLQDRLEVMNKEAEELLAQEIHSTLNEAQKKEKEKKIRQTLKFIYGIEKIELKLKELKLELELKRQIVLIEDTINYANANNNDPAVKPFIEKLEQIKSRAENALLTP